MMLLPFFASAEWHSELGLTQEFVQAPVFETEMRVYLSSEQRAGLPTVTLVHGVGGSAKDFTDIIPLLHNRYNLIVFDLPGYGESFESSTLYSPSNYASSLKQALPDLVADTNYLIGHSMGGNISLQLTALAPELVDKLVLIDPAGMLNKFSYSKYVALNKASEVPFVSEKNQKRFSRFIDSLNNYIPDISDLLLSKPSRKYLFNNNSTYISAISVMSEDLTQILRKVKTPSFIIWGKADPVMPYQAGYMLDSILENSHLELIVDVGHSPQRERPFRVYNSIVAFLSESEGSRTNHYQSGYPKASETDLVLDCKKSPKRLFEEAYQLVSILNCDNLVIDKMQAENIVIENSKVALNYLNIENSKGAALTAINSNVTVWGGQINAQSIANLTTSYVDFNGVEMHTKLDPFDTDAKSQILASVSQLEHKGTNKDLHGFVIKQQE